MGMRPEHVEIPRRQRGRGWPMRVQALEMLGAERLVYGTIGESLFTARLDATLAAPKADDMVGMHASPAQLHWFDAATTARDGA